MISGGDDRIRTCEGLLTLNGLANRRLQPLGHISAAVSRSYSKLGAGKVKARVGTVGPIRVLLTEKFFELRS